MKYLEKLNNKSYMTVKTKTLIRKFEKVCKEKKFRPQTIDTEDYVIYRALKGIGKPIENWTKRDLDKYFIDLEKSGYGAISVNTTKAVLKGFFSKIGLERLGKCIKCMSRKRMRKLPKNLISRDMLNKMLSKCTNSRDRALVYFLYESAARKGEALGLTIGDIEFDEYGAVCVVDGKTGERRIRLIECVPDIKAWLNDHPGKGDSSLPLWVSLGNRNFGQLMKKNNVQVIVGVAGKRAGIQFPIFPHLFRHSRLTELSSIMTEFQLRTFAGWTISSDMTEVYVKRSGVETESVLLEAAGIKRPGKGIKVTKTLCPGCQKSQSPSATFCFSCGSLLETESAKVIKEKPQSDEVLEKKIQEILERILKEKGEKIQSKSS